MTVVALVVVAGPSALGATSTAGWDADIDGRPLVWHTVTRLRAGGADQVVLALDGAAPDAVRTAVADVGDAVAVVDLAGAPPWQTCAPSTSDAEVVLVHDATRALVPVTLVRRVLAAVRAGAAVVVPVLPVVDTVRLAAGDGRASGVVDRDGLRIVQTPHGLAPEALRVLPPDTDLTDLAAAAGAAGLAVTTVPGDADAARIHTAGDLDRARRALTTVPAGATDG